MKQDIYFDNPLKGGGFERLPGTLWRNASSQVVNFSLHVDCGELISPHVPDPARVRLRQARRLKVTITPRGMPVAEDVRAKGLRRWTEGLPDMIVLAEYEVVLPREYDQAIQKTECTYPDCRARRTCRDPEHAGWFQVVGGEALGLIRVAPELGRDAPRLSPLLVERPPTLTASDVDARMLERARGGVR